MILFNIRFCVSEWPITVNCPWGPFIYIYICVCGEIVDFGKSDKMKSG